MWTWKQAAGELWHAGKLIARGYSGRGAGVNNHALQAEPKIGPIPVGRWNFAGLAGDNHTGPTSLIILPLTGTETFGRAGFRCHGDNSQLNHTGSEGCIILQRPVRLQIWTSGDRMLEVVA